MTVELRKDYLLDRWVVIAGNRGKRPSDFVRNIAEDEERQCYFCPGNEHTTPPEIDRIPAKGKWRLRTFPNKFPAVAAEDGEYLSGLFETRPAYGFHEVIVETPAHGKTFTDFTVKQMLETLDMYNQRITELENRRGVAYVCLFKNHGKVSGASLSHSHSQIITTPFTPPLVKAEADASKKYFREHNKCIFCEVIKKESKSDRTIINKDGTLAFTPYASRFPFEVWITPKKHVRRLDELTKKQRESMAQTMITILKKLNKKLSNPSYNIILHYSPENADLHLHWEILPRLSTLAGFEYGSDIIINTMPPEDAARHLK